MNLELLIREPRGAPVGPTLLFVHGAFHAAWCWDEHFLPWFAARRWTVAAVSLRGHGASEGRDRIDAWSFADYVADVLATIDRLGTPVILIGHSMGGVLVEMCRARRPDVVATCFIASSPLRPAPRVALSIFLRRPLALLRGRLTGDMAAMGSALETFFFSDVMPAEERSRLRARLDRESSRAIADVFSRAALARDPADHRPALVIAGQDDWSIPMRDHARLAKQYSAPLVVCAGAHDLMFDLDWRETAAALESWLQWVVCMKPAIRARKSSTGAGRGADAGAGDGAPG